MRIPETCMAYNYGLQQEKLQQYSTLAIIGKQKQIYIYISTLFSYKRLAQIYLY